MSSKVRSGGPSWSAAKRAGGRPEIGPGFAGAPAPVRKEHGIALLQEEQTQLEQVVRYRWAQIMNANS